MSKDGLGRSTECVIGCGEACVDESPAPIETHLVQRALCGDVDVSKGAAEDGAVAAVVGFQLAVAEGR